MKNYIYVLKKLRRFIPYLRPYIPKLIIIFFILLLFTIVSLIQPLINKYAIDVFFKSPSIKVFTKLSLYIMGVFLITKIFSILKENLVTYISCYISLKLRRVLLGKVVNTKYEELNKIRLGDIFVSFDLDIGTIQHTITNTLVNYVLSFLTIIVAAVFMLNISWLFFLAMWVTIPVIIFNNRLWFKPLITISKVLREKTAGVFGYVQNFITNIKQVQIICKDNFFYAAFLKTYDGLIKATFKNLNINLGYGAINDFILNIEQMFLFGVAGYLIWKNHLSIGGYIALSAYAIMFKDNLINIINFDIKKLMTVK